MNGSELTTHDKHTLRGATILFLLRMGMGGVFIGAAWPKILAPDAFALNVLNYQMLPAWGVNTLALVLPWLEMTIGVFLILGFWSRASALIMAALMVVFMVAFASAKSRGLDISCGCFEVGEAQGPSSIVKVVIRDTAFLLASLALVRWPNGPSFGSLFRRLLGSSRVAEPRSSSA